MFRGIYWVEVRELDVWNCMGFGCFFLGGGSEIVEMTGLRVWQ